MRGAGGLKEAVDAVEQGGHGVTVQGYAWLLRECIRAKALPEGSRVHALMQRHGLLQANLRLANMLLAMYGRCGDLLHARTVFDAIARPDLSSWTAIISACANHKRAKQAVSLFHHMLHSGTIPDRFLLVVAIKACAHAANLTHAAGMHSVAVKSGLERDGSVGNSLLSMYIKCGSQERARRVFDGMCSRDVVSWNSMIAGYTQAGRWSEAVALFERMPHDAVQPDSVTFASIVKACAGMADMELGRQIHDRLVKSGVRADAFVEASLIHMYAKCGNLADACKVFDKMVDPDAACWNALIAGHAHHGRIKEALLLLEKMQRKGINPSKVTMHSILKEASKISTLDQVKQVHGHITQGGFKLDSFIGSTLVNMYAKCGSVEDARHVFDQMHKRDVVLWTAMITIYAQQGDGEEAFRLFEQMQQKGLKPDKITFLTILKACSAMVALVLGKEIHAQIIKSGFECDILVGNSLVDMYSKCGSIHDARGVFERMSKRDVISYNALLAGYAQQGYAEEVLRLFGQMQQEKVTPDDITVLCILSACSHAGLVVEGCQLFDSLIETYDITTTAEHYACVVDLLGRAGQLEQAERLINRMPVQPHSRIWLALLGACRNLGNVDLGIQAFENSIRLNPQCSEAYASLLDICALAGRWDAVNMIKKEMKVAAL